MNKEIFNTQWAQLKLAILDRWNKLTDEDLRQINGRYELFLTKIQEKYGISRNEVEEQFRNFRPAARFENERRDVVSPKMARDEETESSLGKWLVLAGIPLLFLLGYLGTQYNANDTRNAVITPTSTTQTLYTRDSTTTTADNAISQNARTLLFDNRQLSNDLNNLRIETTAGAVTVYGTVSSEEQKTVVTSIISQIPGVVSVNNKIEVKE